MRNPDLRDTVSRYISLVRDIRSREIKKKKKKEEIGANRVRIYRAWEVDGAQFRFLRIPCEFPEMREKRIPGRCRRRSRALHPRGKKHSTSSV